MLFITLMSAAATENPLCLLSIPSDYGILSLDIHAIWLGGLGGLGGFGAVWEVDFPLFSTTLHLVGFLPSQALKRPSFSCAGTLIAEVLVVTVWVGIAVTVVVDTPTVWKAPTASSKPATSCMQELRDMLLGVS